MGSWATVVASPAADSGADPGSGKDRASSGDLEIRSGIHRQGTKTPDGARIPAEDLADEAGELLQIVPSDLV